MEDNCSLKVLGIDGLRKYDIFVLLIINNLGQSLKKEKILDFFVLSPVPRNILYFV